MHDQIERILRDVLTAMSASFSGIVRSEAAGQNIFSIQTDDARSLIGAHGDTLQALDMIVKKILEKHIPADATEQLRDIHFIIDVNDYRTQQIKDLQTKAKMMAERARSFQYDVELTPMSAYERLIVHTTLQDAPNIKTESLGEGRGRRVVIKYVA